MTFEEATYILDLSFKNLHKRRNAVHHRVYLRDVEEEVVHNACLTILQNNDEKKASEYASLFTQAAMNMVEIYTEKEAATGKNDIVKNVEWNALWEQLQNYFRETHGIDIGERDLF